MATFPLVIRNAMLDAENARKIAQIALETGGNVADERRKVLSLIGDERQLRGLPAIGRGVQGAIRGTRPGDSLR